VTDLPAGYTLKSIRSGAEDITTTNLVVGADRLSPELTVVLGVTPGAPWSRVVGKVGNVTTRVSIRGGPRGGQTPTPPTAVVLISQSFSEYWLAPIGPGGQFEFARIQPGNYEVRMFPDSQVTPALNLTVPPSAALEIELQAPDVTPLPCPSC
jgi:hypothetical protein